MVKPTVRVLQQHELEAVYNLPLFSTRAPLITNMMETGELASDGVFFLKALSCHCYFQRGCTFPGCSHRHEDKHHRFDFMLLPPRLAAKHAARHAGHKHSRALYAAARRREAVKICLDGLFTRDVF